MMRHAKRAGGFLMAGWLMLGAAFGQATTPPLRGAPEDDPPPGMIADPWDGLPQQAGPPPVSIPPATPPRSLPQGLSSPAPIARTTPAAPFIPPAPSIPPARRFEASPRPNAPMVPTSPPPSAAVVEPARAPVAVRPSPPPVERPVTVVQPPRSAQTLWFASSAEGAEEMSLAGATGLCLGARNGLGPVLEIGGRPAVLTACIAGLAPISLSHGVLYVGAQRTHQIAPMTAPASGCRLVDVLSGVRRNLIGVCTDACAEPGRFEEVLSPPGWARITGQARASGPAYAPGVPAMVVPIGPEGPAAATWALDVNTGRLQAVGTDLCLALPPQDRSVGAPLMLRPCTEATAFVFRAPPRY